MKLDTDLITRREALARAAWLLGGAVSAPTVAGLLAGCGRDAPDPAGSPLTADQSSLISAIAEHIIPETDTPGARGAGVGTFIEHMLTTYYPADERDLFLAGLAATDERANEINGQRFLECTSEQQLALLQALDREAFAARAPVPDEPPAVDVRERTDASGSQLPAEVQADTVEWIHGETAGPGRTPAPFFRTMKELTVVGYYTSEIGATRELRHAAIPGRYEGCVPLGDIGRTWAV